MEQYVIHISSASMPSSCKYGGYKKIAVLKVRDTDKEPPKRIDARDKNVEKIVRIWNRVHLGKAGWDGRSDAAQAMKEAKRIVQKLNYPEMTDVNNYIEWYNEIE